MWYNIMDRDTDEQIDSIELESQEAVEEYLAENPDDYLVSAEDNIAFGFDWEDEDYEEDEEFYDED